MSDENEEIQGPPLASEGTPVLRADATDDEEHRPEDVPDGTMTGSGFPPEAGTTEFVPNEPESPPEASESPAEGNGIPEVATGAIMFASGAIVPVCPVCGLNLCGHNLPYTYAQR